MKKLKAQRTEIASQKRFIIGHTYPPSYRIKHIVPGLLTGWTYSSKILPAIEPSTKESLEKCAAGPVARNECGVELGFL